MNSNITELAICHYHSLNTVERNQIKKSLKKINPEIKMKIIKNKSSPAFWAGLHTMESSLSTSVASQLVSTPVESTHRGLPKGLGLKTNYLKNYFKGYTCTFYSNSYQILNKSFISFISHSIFQFLH